VGVARRGLERNCLLTTLNNFYCASKPGEVRRGLAILLLPASRTPPRLRTSLWKADAAQEVLKARVSAKGIQLGIGGDPGRAVRALVEGFSQP
jgi:hypothetical protein